MRYQPHQLIMVENSDLRIMHIAYALSLVITHKAYALWPTKAFKKKFRPL